MGRSNRRVSRLARNPSRPTRSCRRPRRPRTGQALLVLHNAFSGAWKAAGATPPENAGWLRRIASAPPLEGDDEHAVAAGPALDARLALAAARFENVDPLVAELANDQVACAPYGALVGLADTLDLAMLRAFVAAPGTGARRPSHILLLGLAGGDGDATAIEAQLALARQRQNATDLSALLAANMELRGPGRVAWVEATYLADRDRSLPELEAALSALAVHGEAHATVTATTMVRARSPGSTSRPSTGPGRRRARLSARRRRAHPFRLRPPALRRFPELIVRGWRMLVKTITAFTLAHSITLTLATFGLVTLPSGPVEALIALSIVLLCVEAVRLRRGETSLAATGPSPSPSACCMVSASRAPSSTSACRMTTSRWRSSSSTSASRSASSCSSP